MAFSSMVIIIIKGIIFVFYHNDDDDDDDDDDGDDDDDQPPFQAGRPHKSVCQSGFPLEQHRCPCTWHFYDDHNHCDDYEGDFK